MEDAELILSEHASFNMMCVYFWILYWARGLPIKAAAWPAGDGLILQNHLPFICIRYEDAPTGSSPVFVFIVERQNGVGAHN